MHLAPHFCLFISLDLGVVPALADKVEAAHYGGIVPVASLHCTLYMSRCLRWSQTIAFI